MPESAARGRRTRTVGGRHLYVDVAAELRRRVKSDVYPSGTRIPTAQELTREFGVSMITVRHAIRDLTLEGLLVGRQGLGVFVTDSRRIVRSLNTDVFLADQMRRLGLTPGVKEISLDLILPGDQLARQLGITRRQKIYRHEKVLLADGEPIALDVTYLPEALGRELWNSLAEGFVLSMLQSQNVAVDHIDFQIKGGAVSEREAALLHLPTGFPLLVIHYTPVQPHGAAILTGQTLSRYDRFAYELCMNPSLHGTPRPSRHSLR